MLRTILCVFVISSLIAGCHNSIGAKSSRDTPLQYKIKVVMKDAFLNDRIRVASHVPKRIQGDLLQIQIGFENLKRDDLWCDIQVVFYDENGMEAENTNWQPFLLSGQQISFYNTVSISSGVYDYTIFLREARKTGHF